MNNEHGVVFELDFLFASCKLNETERDKVKVVIENELMDAGKESDDDIEVIKDEETAAEKSMGKDADLEQKSKKRRLSGTSNASSGVSTTSANSNQIQGASAETNNSISLPTTTTTPVTVKVDIQTEDDSLEGFEPGTSQSQFQTRENLDVLNMDLSKLVPIG